MSADPLKIDTGAALDVATRRTLEARARLLERLIGYVSPGLALKRARSRWALEFQAAAYDGAGLTRRTRGWRRYSGDANAAIGPVLGTLRDQARDLVRNNPHAENAISTIADHAVGYGIVPMQSVDVFKRWANSKECSVDGSSNFAGIQKLVMRSVVESGEALVRRRWRRLEDGLPLPLQLQVLEPDYLDAGRDENLEDGGRIIQGVEFSPIGRRRAYWLFREHPGSMRYSTGLRFGQSVRVPASEIAHVYKISRPGQVRAPTWFAPVISRFRDFDEYEDATLMKQKIAACLAIITSDVDGTNPVLGATVSTDTTADSLEPGMILNVDPGRNVDVVQPPSVREHDSFVGVTLRSIAAGLGITYEDFSGDYTGLPFSAARMSRLRHWARVNDWRWRMLEPQLLNPVWSWTRQAAAIIGERMPAETEWTAPPMPMLEPEKEGLASQRNIRAGVTTIQEEIRERGRNVDEFLDELAEGFAELDRRGLVLDSDPRRMTQAGQRHPNDDGGA